MNSRFKQVNRFLNKELNWQPLFQQGTSNELFEAENLVLRLNAPGSISFGVDRTKEKLVLQRILGQPWAAKIIHNQVDHGWLIMERSGNSLVDQPWNFHLESLLFSIMKDFQNIVSIPSFDFHSLFQSYRTKAENNPSLFSIEQVEELIWLHAQLPRTRQCLCHHDLHPGNFCMNGEQLVVLDWEYAGLGNPWLDIAYVWQQSLLGLDSISNLPLADGLSQKQIEVNLERASRFNTQLETCWYQVRRLPNN